MELHLDVGWDAGIWRLNWAGCPGGSLTWLTVDTSYGLVVHPAMLTEAPTWYTFAASPCCSGCSQHSLWAQRRSSPRATLQKSRKSKSPETKGCDKNRHSITSTTLCWSNDVTQPTHVHKDEDAVSISWWGSGKLSCKRVCRMEVILYAFLVKYNLLQG